MNRSSRLVTVASTVLLAYACATSAQQPPTRSPSTPLSDSIENALTLTPAPALTPTITPTQTSTPLPPLVAHEWSQSEPLIVFDSTGGDANCCFRDAFPAMLTLTPGGGLYVIDWNGNTATWEMKTTMLSREESCQLLNSIDRAGFFDYDPSTYIRDPQNWKPPVMGAGSRLISIHAWRSNATSLYGVDSFVNEEHKIREASESSCSACPKYEFPTILPSLRKTFRLLADYEPPNLELYQADRLGIWLQSYWEPGDPVDWPLKSIRLPRVLPADQMPAQAPAMILTGQNAATVYALFDGTIQQRGIDVRDGDRLYRAFARPLFPNEFTSDLPATSLSCSPSDGWIDVP